jgi:hypothetical protein
MNMNITSAVLYMDMHVITNMEIMTNKNMNMDMVLISNNP